ncbi:hypothetical protein LNV23_02175 [Paucibacter sp. DJ1R-11]|uniref:hypothetical protein n=1 Tax=Paucibacter sp. DJ1R-11 TaxID=2893556 RepID=UPI0021E35DEB|nr:hypothetical protein [Paucibacter sp. DJ1R-11]MCV2362254.1 hypothetical protein [Paucibacter sp. DJ1R-11]
MSSVFLLRRAAKTLETSRASLLADGRWELAGSSERATDCMAALHSSRAQYLACDLRLADGHVRRLLQQLRRLPQAPKVLLLSSCAHDTMLFDTLADGAHGYMVECERGSSLPQALSQLQAGQALMSPELARQTLHSMGLSRISLERAQALSAAQDLSPAIGSACEPEQAFNELTRAEQHLLSLIALGRLPGEVAQLWRLASEDVGRRISAIYGKLHRWQSARNLDLALA